VDGTHPHVELAEDWVIEQNSRQLGWAVSSFPAVSSSLPQSAPAFARTFPLSMSLPSQSGIEQMRGPDTGFLQLLPNDRGVRHNISSRSKERPLISRRP
jgi:hypothetical protein